MKIKPKIGFVGEDRQSILEDLEFAAKEGFDFYEVQGVGIKIDLKNSVIRKVRKIVQKNNISLNFHAIFFLPISSSIPQISNAALKLLKKELILARKLGAKLVTVHGGKKESIGKKEIVKKNFETSIKNLREIVKLAKKYGIKVGLENSGKVREGLYTKPEELIDAVKKVKGLGIVFDIGHANLVVKKLKLNLESYFRKIRKFVINVHLHDNHGNFDEHLLIGEGNIDFKKFLGLCKKLKYFGPFIFEFFPKEKVLEGREIFLKLWEKA